MGTVYVEILHEPLHYSAIYESLRCITEWATLTAISHRLPATVPFIRSTPQWDEPSRKQKFKSHLSPIEMDSIPSTETRKEVCLLLGEQ
jgi:hypothetical protein